MKKLKAKFIKRTAKERLYELPVPLVALTGGIATGKSAVSKLLTAKGVPLIDADRLVKDVYATAESEAFIKTHYPAGWKDGAIHFPTLRELVFNDPEAKARIESHIYAALPKAFHEAYHKLGNPPFVVYDVPLLFERHLEGLMDLTIMVYAPRKVQRARIIDRDGHADELAEKILNAQMDIEEKKLKADFVIDNSRGLEELAVEVESLLRQVLD